MRQGRDVLATGPRVRFCVGEVVWSCILGVLDDSARAVSEGAIVGCVGVLGNVVVVVVVVGLVILVWRLFLAPPVIAVAHRIYICRMSQHGGAVQLSSRLDSRPDSRPPISILQPQHSSTYPIPFHYWSRRCTRHQANKHPSNTSILSQRAYCQNRENGIGCQFAKHSLAARSPDCLSRTATMSSGGISQGVLKHAGRSPLKRQTICGTGQGRERDPLVGCRPSKRPRREWFKA